MRLAAAICLLLGLCLATAFAAVDRWIVVRVDGDRFFLGDTIVLDIDSTGLEDPVDFAALDGLADIGRQTAGTRIAVIKGQVVEIKSLRLEIMPKTAGQLTIGPFNAGAVRSNAVVINVEGERPPQWTPGSQDADMSMTVSQSHPWLQQEVALDIRVRHRHPLSDETVTLPKLDGFRVTPVFEERRTIEPADGGWAVLAWRYLVYPQHSGPIAIDAPAITATLSRTRVERAQVTLMAKPVTLDVRPAADTSHWWLPARNVVLKDAWSTEPTGLSAGDEVTRTITVEADGVRPEQIPDIVMADTRGFQITPGSARRSGSNGETGSHATAIFDFKLRAVSPVAIFVDTVRLPWWDTASGQAKSAIIPARRIEIGMPDRDKLIENAGGNSILERLPPMSLPMAALCGLTALALLIGLFLSRRIKAEDPARTVLAKAARQASAGDIRGAVELLRQLPRDHDLWSEVAAIRSGLETQLIAGKAGVQQKRSASDISKLITRMKRSHAGSGLPSL